MRAHVPSYELVRPGSYGEALRLLAAAPGALKPFAGGTDLMVLLEAGVLPEGRFLSLWGLPELRGGDETADALTLGALTTYTDLQEHGTVRREFPCLVRAAAETGGLAIQNRGTLGGNVANASPAADTPPALLCYGAELVLESARGVRTLPYASFHLGYKQTALAPDELVRAVRLPRRAAWTTHFYRKVGTRKAQAISKVVVAAVARVAGGKIEAARVAMGSVAPVPLRLARVEALLAGQAPTPALAQAARAAALADVAPIDDIRSTAAYRGEVAQNLVQAFVESLA